MTKNIVYHGVVKLPFDRIIKIIKKKSTRIDASFDTERSSYLRNRSERQLEQSRKIIELYHPKKNVAYFYRYTNDNLIELIPKNFWRKYNIEKQNCRVQILHHPPGTVSIPHIDRYDSMISTSKNKNNKNKRTKRLWISLTKPRMGQALFVGNEVAYNLKQGTVLSFNKNILHSGCNVGFQDRYVLTVTGFSS